jgi:hypothetical protein
MTTTVRDRETIAALREDNRALMRELRTMPAEVVVRGELDLAWAEAEAALPEGWAITSVERFHDLDGSLSPWSVTASASDTTCPHCGADEQHYTIAQGPTAAAALRALAAKLREVGR